jgi:hypothetical protein
MHFWIDIQFTKILDQFKPIFFCRFIHDMEFQIIFIALSIIIFVNYNYFLNTLLIKFEKKMLKFEFPKQFHTKHNKIKLFLFH